MISIITTVKNGSKFIHETLQSINNQTFRDFEHIVVDDGSTDDTVLILEKFQVQNPKYNLNIYQPGQLGRGKALNFAISKAKHNWIAIIDADDLWHPRKLEIQSKLIVKNPDVALIANNSDVFNNINQLSFSDHMISNFVLVNSNDLLLKNPICHSSVIIKKQFAIYDENRQSQFDLELWYRLALIYKQKLIIGYDILTYHRIHKNQSFESKGVTYRWRAYKLKLYYSIRFTKIYPILYGTVQFIIGSLFSRLKLKNKISKK